jgi:hypothetical protein
MSGSGGYKHRASALAQKKGQHRKKARANVARVRKSFEAKGQTWDPKNNPAQLAALNHEARRLLGRSAYLSH